MVIETAFDIGDKVQCTDKAMKINGNKRNAGEVISFKVEQSPKLRITYQILTNDNDQNVMRPKVVDYPDFWLEKTINHT